MYPPVSAHLVQPGEWDGSFRPVCCGIGHSCQVNLKGYADAGYLLTLTGPVRLRLRQFFCKTHDRTFNICDERFLKWVYGADSPYSWDTLQPDPLFVKHGQTYYSSELLWDMISQFESRVTINQIVENIQQRWLGIWAERRAAFVKHAVAEHPAFDVASLPGPRQAYWVYLSNNQQIMTYRAKLYELLLTNFNTFIRPQFDQDMALAREQLCYGISIDETFKVASKCAIACEADDGKRGYEAVTYAFHTIHSSCTQMMVSCRFMTSKSAEDKAVCVREVMQAQAAAMQAGRPAQPTMFVATDNPTIDRSMLAAVHAEAFPAGHPAHGQLAVGDDVWHAYHRIGEKLPSPALAPGLHASLKKVFHLIYQKAESGDQLPSEDAVANGKQLARRLREWVKQHRMGLKVKQAVHNCINNAADLFTFLPHVSRLVRFGTTANEHGNWSINRKFKFVSHVRPDHAIDSAYWVFFLPSAQCALDATGNFKLTDSQRVLCSQLFVRPVCIPFERLAAKGQPPFLAGSRHAACVHSSRCC